MLKLNKETLLEALSIVNHAVANKASMPVLAHVRLSMDRNKGTVTGTDLENTVIYPIEANCAKKVEVLLPAKKLHDILKNVQSNHSLSLLETGSSLDTQSDSCMPEAMSCQLLIIQAYLPEDILDNSGDTSSG